MLLIVATTNKMIPIQHRDLEKMAQRHWEAIENYMTGKKVKYNIKYYDKKVKKYFPLLSFKEIVLANPNLIDDLASYWDIFVVKDYADFEPLAETSYKSYLTGGETFYSKDKKGNNNILWL